MDHPRSVRDIHIFSDAPDQAYGSVAYLGTENPQVNVEVSFLAVRSCVAPKMQQSIQRLELCAALTGAQLSKVIATELTLPIRSLTLWSDSLTVLTWLTSDVCRYKVSVGTRVAEIQELTGSATWRYVPSGDNPADDITQGLALQDLGDGSRWTHAPAFMKQQPKQWPQPLCSPNKTTCCGCAALRRFIARRGRPYEHLCDQGKKFKVGEIELRQSFAALQPELQAQLGS